LYYKTWRRAKHKLLLGTRDIRFAIGKVEREEAPRDFRNLPPTPHRPLGSFAQKKLLPKSFYFKFLDEYFMYFNYLSFLLTLFQVTIEINLVRCKWSFVWTETWNKLIFTQKCCFKVKLEINRKKNAPKFFFWGIFKIWSKNVYFKFLHGSSTIVRFLNWNVNLI
jgi:hypothetical protein